MYTQNSLPTDSTTGPFPIGFNYLDAATISVTQYDLDGVSNPVAKTFSFAGTVSEDQPNGSTINLDVASASGKIIKIAKTIDMDTPVINWQDGAELTQKNLRKSTRNLMEMAQTAQDKATSLFNAVAEVKANENLIVTLAQVAQVAAELAETNAETAEANVYATISASVATATASAIAAKEAAEAARDSTLAAYDSFDDRYLGAKATDPTLDNDGNTLVAGSLYFNTSITSMKLYTGAIWVAAYVSGGDVLIKSSNLADLPNTTLARANLGLAIGVNVQAYNALLATLNAVQTYTKAQRCAVVALTDAATITPDFSLSNHFSVTLAGNRTLDNPSNLVAGQAGSIFIAQDASGSRTLAYGSFWDFLGGVAPLASTSPNSVDRLDYIVRSSGSIHAVLSRGWS